MFIKRLVRALDRFGVQYAIVGGYAVALHGAVRGTIDIDIVINIDDANTQRVTQALTSLGLVSRIPVGPKEIVQFRKEYIELRNMVAWSFVNPNLPIESVDIIITHDLSEIKTCKKSIGDLPVTIIDRTSLIAMKRAAGRRQDLEDVSALEKI